MPKTPSVDETGYYHIVIPFETLQEAWVESDVHIHPISEEQAKKLADTFHGTGRNQACPCGSGVKFKRCCLRRAS